MSLFENIDLTKDLDELGKKIKNGGVSFHPIGDTNKSEENDFYSCVAELSPIEVATKLINAKMWIPEHTTFGIKYEGCYSEVFDIEQLREIAAYLTVYCMYNKEEQ